MGRYAIEIDKELLRNLYQNKYTIGEIAKKFGVSYATVHKALKRTSYYTSQYKRKRCDTGKAVTKKEEYCYIYHEYYKKRSEEYLKRAEQHCLDRLNFYLNFPYSFYESPKKVREGFKIPVKSPDYLTSWDDLRKPTAGVPRYIVKGRDKRNCRKTFLKYDDDCDNR